MPEPQLSYFKFVLFSWYDYVSRATGILPDTAVVFLFFNSSPLSCSLASCFVVASVPHVSSFPLFMIARTFKVDY